MWDFILPYYWSAIRDVPEVWGFYSYKYHGKWKLWHHFIRDRSWIKMETHEP